MNIILSIQSSYKSGSTLWKWNKKRILKRENNNNFGRKTVPLSSSSSKLYNENKKVNLGQLVLVLVSDAQGGRDKIFIFEAVGKKMGSDSL